MVGNRIEYIDLAKGFCICFVVMFHIMGTIPIIGTQITSFRMPLYFFLSGVFFKSYENLGGFLKRKINKLLIPYIFFQVILGYLYPYIMFYVFGRECPCSYFSNMWFFMECKGVGGPVWFLWCLFVMNIIFYFVYTIGKRCGYFPPLFIFLLGSVGFLLGYYRISLPRNIDSALTAMPFFYFGYVLFRQTNMFQPNKYDRYFYVIIAVLVCLLYCFSTTPTSYLFNKFNTSSSPLISMTKVYCSGLAGTLLILLISKKLGHIPFISYLGRYSIMILCTHRFIYLLIEGGLGYIGLSSNTNNILTFVFTMLSYCFVIPFMKKYMPYVTAQKDVIKII